MHTLFLDAPYTGKVELCKETINYLKQHNITCLALYASVQFVNNLEIIHQQLTKLNITILTTKADRTHVKTQLLGCDSELASLHLSEKQFNQIQTFLYIGDGRFHPYALVYAQKDIPATIAKPIICNDPIAKKFTLTDTNIIRQILRKYRASLMKFLVAKNIGVIVTIKPGQEHLIASYRLEKKFSDKTFYFFIDDVVSFNQLENFPFIDIWINTTCPRVGLDDQEKFTKGVINLNDAFMVREVLGKESLLMKI
jgi:diphthamide biosynthesis enzyme Dph1/Dph2-like protein